MPVYTYKCNRCGTLSDKVRKVEERNDEALCHCCGSLMERSLTSNAGFVFHMFGRHKSKYNKVGGGKVSK